MSEIKKVFRSRFENGWIIESDFSQLEIFALAFLANDTNLKDDLLTGKDLHCVSGSLLTGRTYEEFHKFYMAGDTKITLERKLAKQLSFQLQYGSGPTNMAKKNGITIAQAKNFINAYYARYKGVEKYHKILLEIVQTKRFPSEKRTTAGLPAGVSKFRSITGRYYTFYEQDNPYGLPNFSPTQVKNYPVQGFATADIVPMVLGHLQEKIFREELTNDVLLINTVHDSILLDTSKGCKDKAIQICKEVMESAPELLKMYFDIDFDLPLKVGISAGKNWLEMETVI